MRPQTRRPRRPEAIFAARLACLACLVFLAVLPAAPLPAAAQAGVEDESLLLPIRIAVRAGDMDLAQARLGSLEKPRLVAMGTAAIAHEVSLGGDAERAAELLAEAREIADLGEMRRLERVQSYLYFARLISEWEDAGELAQEMIDVAADKTATLAGIDFDLAVTDMVTTILATSGDRQQAYEMIRLLSDKGLQQRLIETYGLADLAG